MDLDSFSKDYQIKEFSSNFIINASAYYGETDKYNEVYESEEHEVTLSISDAKELYDLLNMFSKPLTIEHSYEFRSQSGSFFVEISHYYENPSYETELLLAYDKDEVQQFSRGKRNGYIEHIDFHVYVNSDKDSIEFYFDAIEVKSFLQNIKDASANLFNRLELTLIQFCEICGIHSLDLKESKNKYKDSDDKILYVNLEHNIIGSSNYMVLSKIAAYNYLNNLITIKELCVTYSNSSFGLIMPPNRTIEHIEF